MKSMKTNMKAGNRSSTEKTIVKIFNHDGVRELLIPSEKPNYHPVVLSNDHLEDLKQKAVKKPHVDPIKERERLTQLSRQRKAKFRKIDAKSTKESEKLSELEQEAKEKASYLLKRAWELRMEQEDDVKAANSLILKTKCQAIRDAQIAEQALIKKKWQEEEQRIEKAMEEKRIQKILTEQRNMEQERSKKEKYVKELAKQIEEIQYQKLLEFEKTIQERQRLNKAMYVMMVEEVRKQKESEAAKGRRRKELAKANEEILRAHMIEKEEARLADLKIQEWMRQRAQREETLEREQAEAKKRKELETARLRVMQEKAGELQALQDHMIAVRRQEEYEREWRRKEKEAAMKKKKMNKDIMEVRNRQVIEMRQIQASEIAREKQEYERIMMLHKEAEERERAQEAERRLATNKYRETLLLQINDKEAELIARRREDLAEGVAMRAEAARREEEVRKVLEAKVVQMRAHKVPEVYVADIIRQLHLNDNNKNHGTL